MNHSEHKLKSKDGTELHLEQWLPNNAPKAVINFVHGIGEHPGRYHNWANLFCDKEIGFVAISYRGHGKSDGKRGAILDYEELLQDIDALFRYTENQFPEIPHILYGHSLGGNIATNYYISRKPAVKKLIITSPWYRLTKPLPVFLVKIIELKSMVLPKLTLPSGLNVNDLSHDKAICEAYSADRLNHNRISLKLFAEAHKKGLLVFDKANEINIPMLLMHGEKDRITSSKASSEMAAINPNIEFKLWEGMYHELHNETNFKEVFNYLINWAENN